jgi:hypothetical protein
MSYSKTMQQPPLYMTQVIYSKHKRRYAGMRSGKLTIFSDRLSIQNEMFPFRSMQDISRATDMIEFSDETGNSVRFIAKKRIGLGLLDKFKTSLLYELVQAGRIDKLDFDHPSVIGLRVLDKTNTIQILIFSLITILLPLPLVLVGHQEWSFFESRNIDIFWAATVIFGCLIVLTCFGLRLVDEYNNRLLKRIGGSKRGHV